MCVYMSMCVWTAKVDSQQRPVSVYTYVRCSGSDCTCSSLVSPIVTFKFSRVAFQWMLTDEEGYAPGTRRLLSVCMWM